jgi:hypothetical protein
MEKFVNLYHVILAQAASVKRTILSILGEIPFLKNVSDQALEWIFIVLVFVVAVAVIYPLFKWSAKIAIGAAAIAGILTLITSMSFWGLLPYTGLGVAIVLFSNKFQTE